MTNIFCFRIVIFSLLLVFLNACSEDKSAQDKGQELIEQKKFPEALAWYNKRIEEEKSPFVLQDLYYRRATIHHAMHQLDLALSDINWAILIDSTNTMYLGEKGDVYYEKHSTQDAETQYRKNSILEPKQGIWLYKIGKCQLLREEIPTAIENLERAEKLGYKEADLYMQLGISYHRAGQLDKCCAALKKAAELGNKEVEVFIKNLHCS